MFCWLELQGKETSKRANRDAFTMKSGKVEVRVEVFVTASASANVNINGLHHWVTILAQIADQTALTSPSPSPL
jgi:hypothetical protein